MKLFFSAMFLLALSSCATTNMREPSSADMGSDHRSCAQGQYADSDFCHGAHRY